MEVYAFVIKNASIQPQSKTAATVHAGAMNNTNIIL